MLKYAKFMVLFNLVMAVLFLVLDYALVQSINEWSTIAPTTVNWGAFSINLGPGSNPPIIEGVKTLGNTPFMVFFFTMIGNLMFLVLQKGKE